jgi:alpha-D-ribose 1-methylphosphonate 5-triphosphate synthase subunit PhnI
MAEGEAPRADEADPLPDTAPHVLALLNGEGLIAQEEAAGNQPGDITREPLAFPADRATRLQVLARGDEGFLLALAYSSQRGYGNNHAFVGELRIGAVALAFEIPELGLVVEIGEIVLTECETVNQFAGSKTEPPQFTRGYGLVFGRAERKALAMALVDRALRKAEIGDEQGGAPVEDQEFVLSHADNVQSMGFLEHIKLPHYVDFQSELEMIRRMRSEIAAAREAAE